MEDPSGELGEDRRIVSAVQKDKIPQRWSVLLIDDVGRTISFYLSKRVGFAIIASLAVLLIFFIYLALSLVLMLRENSALRKDFDLLTADFQRVKSDREKALVQLMLSKESSQPTARKPVPAPVLKPTDVARPEEETFPDQDAGPKMEVSEEPKPVAVAPQPPPPTEEKTAEPHSEARVSVDKLEIWQEPGANNVKFQFVVKNANRESGKVAGYTFLVLTPYESSTAVPHRAFPDARLAGGKPSDFKQGLYFSIARYKSVHGMLAGINMISRYKTVTIYAYSDTGDLLIERAFEITKVLRA
ncbi:MAG: hypothetical protein JRJ47_02155 [Deltaproteobacteria bacterium]|nr:hypothetical protein [Deltaproteobacteria bacterium]